MIIDFSNLKTLHVPEGEVIFIKKKHNEEILWRDPSVNWVPLSIDTDKSIYNGTGYKDGYRLSSSGELKTQTKSAVTGFIPAGVNNIITMSGVDWPAPNGYAYIIFYNKNFTKLATLNVGNGGTASNNVSNIVGGTILNSNTSTHSIVKDANGVYTFDLTYLPNASFDYIRISAEGFGANMIVNIS